MARGKKEKAERLKVPAVKPGAKKQPVTADLDVNMK